MIFILELNWAERHDSTRSVSCIDKMHVFAWANKNASSQDIAMQKNKLHVFENLIGAELGYLINAVRNEIFRELEKEFVPLGLTASQFIVVIGAMRGRARTVNEFCRFAGIEPGPMSRLLDRLEAKGIVRRVKDCLDRRQVNVELTEKGTQLYPQVLAILTKVYQKFLDGFDPVEAGQLQFFLHRLLANGQK